MNRTSCINSVVTDGRLLFNLWNELSQLGYELWRNTYNQTSPSILLTMPLISHTHSLSVSLFFYLKTTLAKHSQWRFIWEKEFTSKALKVWDNPLPLLLPRPTQGNSWGKKPECSRRVFIESSRVSLGVFCWSSLEVLELNLGTAVWVCCCLSYGKRGRLTG